MFSAAEFRRYAEESISAAHNAKTDERRKHFLDMAKMWTKAAAGVDGGSMVPKFPDEEAQGTSS